MLEEQDWKLLDLLQQDARLSNQELADRVGLSASSLDDLAPLISRLAGT